MRFTKRLKRFFLHITLRPLLFLGPRIPKAFLPLIAKFTFLLAKPFLRKEYENLERNMEIVLKLPKSERAAFADACIKHQIICALETLNALHHSDNVRIDGLEKAEADMARLSQKDRGLIAVTAHCGSWEISGSIIARLSPYPAYALAKPAKQKFLTDFMTKLREKQKNMTVVWNNDPKLLRRLIAAIKEKATIGIVMDQRPNQPGEPDVQFFGQPTDFVAGPAKLALQYDTPIISIYCLRVGPFHYVCETKEISFDFKQTTSQELNQKLAADMENVIRRYPEQWTWNYKRWKLNGSTPTIYELNFKS